jgi:hypothetical protein
LQELDLNHLPQEKWSPYELTPPVPYPRDGFYAVLRGGPFHRFDIEPILGHSFVIQMPTVKDSLFGRRTIAAIGGIKCIRFIV